MTNTMRFAEMVTSDSSITYGVVKPGDEDAQGVRLVRSGDVIASITNLNDLRTITRTVSDQYKRTILKGGELLISLVGNPGEVMIAPTEFAGHNIARQVAMVRLKSDFDNRYVYYSLKSPKIRSALTSLSKGSVQQVINLSDLQQLEIDVPSINKQKAIAHILGTLDDKIEINQKMNQTLEEIAKAIFKSWFVDFDPVRAKAEGRPTGLSPEISDLFPDELVDSEIGEIPKGWEIAELSKYVDVLNGFAFKSKDYESDGVFVLRTKNFDQGLVKKLTDDVFLPSSFMTSNSKHICEPYDYHLVMVGASIGSRGMLFPHQLPALRNQNMWCFRSKNKSNFSQLLVKLYLDNFIDSKMGLASGSAREFFRKGDFQSHRLCFATPSVRGYFSNCYSVMLEKIQNNLAQIETLSELRDTLLPKLISGELRIPDAEKFLEEAGI